MESHRDIALTHPPLLSHICVSIGSDNGLSPVQHQAITWTNACLLSNGPLGTNFSEIRTKIQNFLFKKMHFKMSPAKRRPLCPGRDELILCYYGHFVFVDQTFGWPVKVTTSFTFSALIHDKIYEYTVRCRYNTVNFLQNHHNRHPLGRVMGCLLWF